MGLETVLKFYELSSEAKVTYEVDVAYSLPVESIKTMQMDAKFYELIDKQVMPYIKSNSGSAMTRVTYQMSKDVTVEIRSVYRL